MESDTTRCGHSACSQNYIDTGGSKCVAAQEPAAPMNRLPTSQERLPVRVFYYRGDVERGADYHWVSGYSEQGDAGPCFPWRTEREIRAEGHTQGFRPVFRREVAP